MLPNGLYEQVINKSLDAELATTDKLVETAAIDGAEAAKVLAKYVAEVVERGLENVKDNGGDLETQIELVNRIVRDIAAGTNEGRFDSLSVAQRAEQLLALMERKNSVLAMDERAGIVRPETSIAQSSLFTGSLHEPQMYTERASAADGGAGRFHPAGRKAAGHHHLLHGCHGHQGHRGAAEAPQHPDQSEL